jgi:dipeptide/tripeptide permease
MEGIVEKKLNYPRGIPFIILSEFFERFNNHGIRSMLFK